jgi:serine/threonine-protein kinase
LVRASELFGKYRLGPRIAQGGMGEVLRAVYCPEGGFERPVALKRINSELSQQPQVVESFRSEAALCSRLLHPNIVQVLDFGRVEDTYFLSMEFVDGGTLGELLWRAQKAAVPVPERVVVQVGRDILAGLSFAYDEARGADGKLLRVLHRDLNPPNVLLSRTGMSKVSDFGIARVGADASDTNSQVVIGKPSYMSPEQASGEPQDGRSDLFAVGIILWELLCGRKLFERGGDSENMLAIVNEDAPPPSRFRALDARWDAFFSRALARALEERFQSAAEMRDALTTLLPGAPPGPADVEAFMARMGEVAPESVASRAGPGPDAKTTLMPPPTR